MADNLLEENTGTEPEPFPVELDEPVEGPANVAEPPIPTAVAPGPDVVENAWPPPVPAAETNVNAPQVPITAPGATPPPATAVSPAGQVTTGDQGVDLINRQREQDKEKAQAEADTAARDAEIARQRADDQRLIDADFAERRNTAMQRLDAATKQYEQNSTLVDPRQRPGEMVKARLATIFGGIGAGLTAAGGGSSKNEALATVLKKWDDDTARQKVNIDALHDKVVLARTGIKDVDEARAALTDAANARNLAEHNAALKFGEARLKRQGLNQAEIDADSRIQALKASRALAAAKAQKDLDAHNLNQAKIALLRHKAGAGGAGGGTSAKEENAVRKEISSYEQRTEGKTINVRGKVDTVAGIQALRGELDKAVASGDGTKMRDAAIAVQEKAGNLLSGGKTTNFQGHLIESPKTLQDMIQEKLGSITGNPTAGKAYLNSLKELLNTVEGPHLEEIDKSRAEDVERLVGPGGIARTPKAKENALNLIKSRYKGVKNPDGTPRYDEGKEAPKQAAPDLLEQAKAAIKPGSGATAVQRANAAKYIKSRLGKSADITL